MSKTHWGPRAGGRAYLALQLLLQFGPLDVADWMIHANASKSASKFEREVTGPLTRWKLVGFSAGTFSITPAGRDFLDERTDEPVDQVVVSGRYAHPIQPLAVRHRPPQRPMREGAFDYRNIPSRCANVSVPFKSSIKLESEQG